jgi:hypothetical protein
MVRVGKIWLDFSKDILTKSIMAIGFYENGPLAIKIFFWVILVD